MIADIWSFFQTYPLIGIWVAYRFTVPHDAPLKRAFKGVELFRHKSRQKIQINVGHYLNDRGFTEWKDEKLPDGGFERSVMGNHAYIIIRVLWVAVVGDYSDKK